MRDKLIELIKMGGVIIPETAEAVADHLIENNVFVLPDKLKDSWELTSVFVLRLFCANEEEVAKIKQEFECQKIKQILTDIRDYLVAILDEWHRRIDEPNFYEQNIGVYNHIRKELDDLTEYAKKLGVEL
jgi:hypothetical protein